MHNIDILKIFYIADLSTTFYNWTYSWTGRDHDCRIRDIS